MWQRQEIIKYFFNTNNFFFKLHIRSNFVFPWPTFPVFPDRRHSYFFYQFVNNLSASKINFIDIFKVIDWFFYKFLTYREVLKFYRITNFCLTMYVNKFKSLVNFSKLKKKSERCLSRYRQSRRFFYNFYYSFHYDYVYL